MVHVRRMLGDLSTLMETGQSAGLEIVDIKVRLGVRLPPVGKAIQGLLRTCRSENLDVGLRICEINECEILTTNAGCRLGIAFMTRHTLWPRAVACDLHAETLPRGVGGVVTLR
jgi:hypothetical protein